MTPREQHIGKILSQYQIREEELPESDRTSLKQGQSFFPLFLADFLVRVMHIDIDIPVDALHAHLNLPVPMAMAMPSPCFSFSSRILSRPRFACSSLLHSSSTISST